MINSLELIFISNFSFSISYPMPPESDDLSLSINTSIFEEDTPYNLIKQQKPDIIVKGGDYNINGVVGNDLAEVHIFEFINGYSTTKIIKNISNW